MNTIKQCINATRYLIILLILWNVLLTINSIKSPFPQFTDSDNLQIMNIESIPYNDDLPEYIESLQE